MVALEITDYIRQDYFDYPDDPFIEEKREECEIMSKIDFISGAFSNCNSLHRITITTREKEPDNIVELVDDILIWLGADVQVLLKVPVGRGYAYRHCETLDGKVKEVIACVR